MDKFEVYPASQARQPRLESPVVRVQGQGQGKGQVAMVESKVELGVKEHGNHVFCLWAGAAR